MSEEPKDKSDTPSNLVVELDDRQTANCVFGHQHEHLRYLQRALGVEIHVRDRRLTMHAQDEKDLEFARDVIVQLCEVAEHGYHLMPDDIPRSVRILKHSPHLRLADIYLDTVLKTDYGRPITPKGPAQKVYIDAIRRHDIVFGVGPAGTGKTYLAMAMALDAFLKKRVQRIILTRPAVEAGERLGFLPGDLAEKVNPYLRPLNDALNDMMDRDRAHQLLERGQIEVAPLAFMRGRTLNASFVILDEAQNSTREQMKMFLTRLGFDTKTVITGDITQIDLPDNKMSGLLHAIKILKDIQGIQMCTFTELDVVRHPLVAEIIKAYDRDDRLTEK